MDTYIIMAFSPELRQADPDSIQSKMMHFLVKRQCETMIMPKTQELCIKLYVGDERLSEFMDLFAKPAKDGTFNLEGLEGIEGLKIMQFKG
jgi:hypothetical protein